MRASMRGDEGGGVTPPFFFCLTRGEKGFFKNLLQRCFCFVCSVEGGRLR